MQWINLKGFVLYICNHELFQYDNSIYPWRWMKLLQMSLKGSLCYMIRLWDPFNLSLSCGSSAHYFSLPPMSIAFVLYHIDSHYGWYRLYCRGTQNRFFWTPNVIFSQLAYLCTFFIRISSLCCRIFLVGLWNLEVCTSLFIVPHGPDHFPF